LMGSFGSIIPNGPTGSTGSMGSSLTEQIALMRSSGPTGMSGSTGPPTGPPDGVV
jgi:hypothetical protein